MSATVYKKIKIHSVDIGTPVCADSLFSTTIAIVVMAQSYESNVFPVMPTWSILYIGSDTEFQNTVIPDLAAQFDSRLSKGHIASSGKALKSYLASCMVEVTPLSISTFSRLGFTEFTYSDEEYSSLIDQTDYRAVKYLASRRHAHRLKGTEDISTLAKSSMHLRQMGGGKWWCGRPYLSQGNLVTYSQPEGKIACTENF